MTFQRGSSLGFPLTFTIVLMTNITRQSRTMVMGKVCVVVFLLTPQKIITATKKTFEGMASVKMLPILDQTQLLVHRHHSYLILGQILLKKGNLVQAARSSRYVRQTMQFLRQFVLHGTTLTDVFVTIILVSIRFHRHQGSSATKFVVVVDDHHTFLTRTRDSLEGEYPHPLPIPPCLVTRFLTPI